MKRLVSIVLLFVFINSFAQNEQTIINTPKKPEASPVKIFYSQKLINAKTVEVLHKGVLDFAVTHNFGDIAGGPGKTGGINNFFGLDEAEDIKISFQLGLSDKFNLIASRSKGGSTRPNFLIAPHQLWELGLKWQLMTQTTDANHPFSMTVFANTVVSSQPSRAVIATPRNQGTENDTSEASFYKFSDRLSEVVQLMVARKFGNISLQLSPTYVHRSLVQKDSLAREIDDKSIFALGGAARIPLSKKIILILDYFHSFHSEESVDALKKDYPSRNVKFYDPLGVGIEIVTEGHIFNLNFTNSTSLLENRFIPRTTTSWSKGQFRWGFTISRKFMVFKDKKKS